MAQVCNEERPIDFMITDKTNRMNLYSHVTAACKRRYKRLKTGQGRRTINTDVDVKATLLVSEAPKTPSRTFKKRSKGICSV